MNAGSGARETKKRRKGWTTTPAWERSTTHRQKQGPGKRSFLPSRSCSFRFGSSHREGVGNHRLHFRITSGAGGVHHRASVAGVGPGVALDILDSGAATPDRHMVDDLFFRDVLAIADKTHTNHPFADILPYQIIGDRPQLKKQGKKAEIMLLTDITKIIRVLLGAFEEVALQDELIQRRIGQIGQVIGAVEDVAETEEHKDATLAEKRVEEAHDIIHRIAAILALEEGRDEGGGDDALREEIWNGKLDGETIELKEDEEE